MKKRLAILGSTGSIGTQTLDVVRKNPERYEVYAISANSSVQLLIEQAHEFKPEVVCIADESRLDALRDGLADLDCKVWGGADSIAEMVTFSSIDIVVAAMVGYAGLRPTIEAIRAGKTIALANKETLVVAGEIICELAQQYHTPILPVDSEHSAIFQSLVGEDKSEIEKILLTASGGPFRTFTREQMQTVTAADALRHPNWDMGAKITIDSASMMNKGFEVIEAKWLFGVSYDQIEVLVHPQSIVHSAVQFTDGAIKAQLGAPDMREPIQYALSYPHRLPLNNRKLDFAALKSLEFFAPDLEKFPCLALAFEAIKRGGTAPAVMNAANEVAVKAYLEGKTGFYGIADLISRTMDSIVVVDNPSLDDIFAVNDEAVSVARRILG